MPHAALAGSGTGGLALTQGRAGCVAGRPQSHGAKLDGRGQYAPRPACRVSVARACMSPPSRIYRAYCPVAVSGAGLQIGTALEGVTVAVKPVVKQLFKVSVREVDDLKIEEPWSAGSGSSSLACLVPRAFITRKDSS